MFWLGGTISISMFRGRRGQPRAGGNEARAVTGSRDGAQPKARRTGGLPRSYLACVRGSMSGASSTRALGRPGGGGFLPLGLLV